MLKVILGVLTVVLASLRRIICFFFGHDVHYTFYQWHTEMVCNRCDAPIIESKM